MAPPVRTLLLPATAVLLAAVGTSIGVSVVVMPLSPRSSKLAMRHWGTGIRLMPCAGYWARRTL